jgi:hypothetical protein
MFRLFIIFLLAISVQGSSQESFADSSTARLSIVRPLGFQGDFGKQILSVTCEGSSSSCLVTKAVKGKVIETKHLAREDGIRIISRLAQAKKSSSISGSASGSGANALTWSLDYQGQHQEGQIPRHTQTTQPDLLAIMQADTDLTLEAK